MCLTFIDKFRFMGLRRDREGMGEGSFNRRWVEGGVEGLERGTRMGRGLPAGAAWEEPQMNTDGH